MSDSVSPNLDACLRGELPPTFKVQPDRLVIKGRVLDDERIVGFLRELAKHGQVGRAANDCGLNRKTLYKIKKRDPEFAEAWQYALDDAVECLEVEARRRAVEGDAVPVFNRNGEQVGEKIERSDQLLMFLMKGNNPEKFGDRKHLNVNGNISLDKLVMASLEEAVEGEFEEVTTENVYMSPPDEPDPDSVESPDDEF